MKDQPEVIVERNLDNHHKIHQKSSGLLGDSLWHFVGELMFTSPGQFLVHLGFMGQLWVWFVHWLSLDGIVDTGGNVLGYDDKDDG